MTPINALELFCVVHEEQMAKAWKKAPPYKSGRVLQVLLQDPKHSDRLWYNALMSPEVVAVYVTTLPDGRLIVQDVLNNRKGLNNWADLYNIDQASPI